MWSEACGYLQDHCLCLVCASSSLFCWYLRGKTSQGTAACATVSPVAPIHNTWPVPLALARATTERQPNNFCHFITTIKTVSKQLKQLFLFSTNNPKNKKKKQMRNKKGKSKFAFSLMLLPSPCVA